MILVAFCLLLFFAAVFWRWFFGAGCFWGVGLCGTVYLRTCRVRRSIQAWRSTCSCNAFFLRLC